MTVDPSGTMKLSPSLLSRRNVIRSIGAIGVMASTSPNLAFAQVTSTPEPPTEITATMPQWVFSLVGMIDPYEAVLTRPGAIPNGHRIVAYEVVLSNLSPQPLSFDSDDIRVRTIDGVESRAGEYIGSESRIVGQNLAIDDRTRGWVWFAIPVDTEVDTLLFLAPRPQLRINTSF